MSRPIFVILALASLAALSGCANTLSGAKQDAATDTQKTQAAADQAGQAVKSDAQKAGQALDVGPQTVAANALRVPVKTAIIRDPVLAQPGNLINVNASPMKITLTGHVTEASMQQRATDDAQVVLRKHPGYTLDNELTVAGAAP